MKKRKAAILFIIPIAFCIYACVILCITDESGEIGFENVVLVEGTDEAVEINKPEETTVCDVCEDSPLPVHSPGTGEEDEESPVVDPVGEFELLASITIQTDSNTYDIAEGVSEETLNNSIGHLPASALPGQEGVCLLMGHRDTEFKILQCLDVGDVLILSYKHESYGYAVTKFEILNADDELRFESLAGENLVLATCYPFRYTGHAPQKFLVYAKRIN